MNFCIRLIVILFLQVLFYSYGLCQNKDTTAQKNFVITDILVQGNRITKYSIISRELTFKKGDTIKGRQWKAMAERSRDNLNNTSLFTSVKIDTIRLATGELDALIQLQERWYLFPLPIFKVEERNFSSWWEQDHHMLDKADYGVGLEYDNVWGLKQKLTLLAQFGYTKQFGLSYGIPYLTKKQAGGISFSFSYSENNQIPYTSIDNILTYVKYPSEILVHAYAGSVDYSYRQGLYNTNIFEADIFSVGIADTILKLTKDYLPFNQTSATFPEVKYYFKRDLRNDAAYPLNGYFTDFSINEYGMGIKINNQPFNLLYFQASFHKYWTITPYFYYSTELEGKVSQNGTQPYYLQKALGYSNGFVRGYELYVIDGNDYALVKNEVRLRVLNIPVESFKIPFLNVSQFNEPYFAVYLAAFSDWGFVGAPNPNVINNTLANTPIWGNGFGLDFVTYYNYVFRMEYSFNQLGQSGFFFHFTAPM